MSELDNFKSKITYAKKPLFGAIAVIVLAVFLAFSPAGFRGDPVRAVLVLLPAIFLLYPHEGVRYNIALAVVSGIAVIASLVYLIQTMSIISFGYGFYLEELFRMICYGLLIIIHVYLLFCACLLAIPNENQAPNALYLNNNMNAASNAKFCKECGAKVNGNLPFCPECGKKL